MSALVVIGTFCIRFVYMGGFLFNEIITYKKKNLQLDYRWCACSFLSKFSALNIAESPHYYAYQSSFAKRSPLNSTSPNLAQIDIKLVSTTLVPFCSVGISGLQTPHSTFTYNTKPELLCHASSSCQKFPQRGGPSEKVSCGRALTFHILSMEKTSHP
jgi:hypothetical protein